MRSQSSLVERFKNGAESGSASNLFIDGAILYSYGRHFPLAIRQDWGAGVQYLINGDDYSFSTRSHQGLCIHELTPNVQIPFSALDSAGLTDPAQPKADLRIVAHRRDRYYQICKHCGKEAVYDGDDHAYRHEEDRSPLCPEAEGEAVSHHVLGAVVLTYKQRFFLSSIDEQEGWRARAYFLCQLPKAVASIEEAFDALVPDEVREAKATNVEVRRQGDIFVMATTLQTRHIQAPTQRHLRLFETAHVATEARVNSAVYIRGTLRHLPERRRPQHRVLNLGSSWWIAVKNTALGSWNAVGNVD
jgi:hypothetical protein